MPTPIGHALGGLITGWLVDAPPPAPSSPVSTPGAGYDVHDPRDAAGATGRAGPEGAGREQPLRRRGGDQAPAAAGAPRETEPSLAAPWLRPALFATAGVLADVDLLAGIHSTYTHSLGAAAIVLVAAWTVLGSARLRARLGVSTARRQRVALAVGAAYASHILLDWLAEDTSFPYGIMALWPLSSQHYLSHLDVFTSTLRQYWRADFLAVNLRALGREILILGPLALLTWRRRGRRPGRENVAARPD